jgi:hypothetical protein
MNNHHPALLARFRSRPLTACLSIALGTGSMMAVPAFATQHYVTNCQDNYALGSLRVVATDPSVKPFDVIDLTGLPLACGTKDSVITLEHGAIPVHDSLTFLGPALEDGSVTIVASPGSRVITHSVGGALIIKHLTIANGHDGNRGGCIWSAGDVGVQQSVVKGCSLSDGGGSDYLGGAIYAMGGVGLAQSHVSGSTVTKQAPDAFFARGGGIFANGDIVVSYSSVSDNHVVTAIGGRGQGGGLYTPAGTIYMNHSTIENNSATGQGGGMAISLGPVRHSISDSTISNNTGLGGGGINLTGYGSLSLDHSTIAFNHATYSAAGLGGLAGCIGCSVTMDSTIVANNTDGVENASSDLYLDPALLQGSKNLVMSSNLSFPPAGFITVSSDPKLAPLNFNGGSTRTHALLAGSPAVGMGKPIGGYSTDQRGVGYPRSDGLSGKIDIGAYEYDSIFANGLQEVYY